MNKLIKISATLFAIALLVVTAMPTQAQAKKQKPPTDPARMQEYFILYQYINEAPKLPKKTIKSALDVAAVQASVGDLADVSNFSTLIPHMDSKSQQMLAQTPLFVSDVNAAASASPSTFYKAGKVKIYKGGIQASWKITEKDSKGKKSTSNWVFVKENEQWKLDFIGMTKLEVK